MTSRRISHRSCGLQLLSLLLALTPTGRLLADAPALAVEQTLAAESLTREAPAVRAVGHIAMTVTDLDRSVEFFQRVLDFRLIEESESFGPALERLTGVFGARCRTARLRLGDEALELRQYLAPRGRPIPPDSRSNDGWFQHIAIVTTDMDTAYARLRAHGVAHVSTGPQRLPDWNPDAGGIEAFYFRDPDGHVLEVIAFPPGKGDPKWPTRRGLFLGIDHTAIVVADTDRSLAFYRGRLGLRVAGHGENHGGEQARLNQVPGARLRITALRAAQGPGVELLEYLEPGPGRPYPADAQPNDLLHWHTAVVAEDVPGLADALEPADDAAAPLPTGDGLGVFVRDPDGHAVLITDRP